MAVPRVPQTKQEEPNIIMEVPYNSKLALPARLASEFLPHIRCVEENYTSGGYTYKISNETIGFKLLSADIMTTAVVTAAITSGE